VNHNVRTKLDEIKRSELERLRHLATKEYELRHGMDTEHLKIPPEHLDLSNPHTFEIEDLRKLILKVARRNFSYASIQVYFGGGGVNNVLMSNSQTHILFARQRQISIFGILLWL
jgi:hypothetical protein